jgi:hypothetical protein
MDQLGAVIDRHHPGIAREAGADLRDLCLGGGDDVERVLAGALHGNPAHHLAVAVQLGNAASFIGPQLDPGHVAQQHRRAAVGLQHDLLQVGGAAQIAAAAHHELGLRHLDRAAADVHVAGAHGLRDFGQPDTVRFQTQRVDDDVVLAHEAADAGDLGNAFGLGHRIADGPVLSRAQLGEIAFVAQHRVLVDPADAGGVRPEAGRDAGRQPARREVQILQHAAACPVLVGAVLEDDVDERHAEEREATHRLGVGHAQHRRGQRVGDLVLDHLWRLPGIFGVDDDLGVGEVGNGIERHARQRECAGADREQGEDAHQHQVARRPRDDARDHGLKSSPLRGEGKAATPPVIGHSPAV